MRSNYRHAGLRLDVQRATLHFNALAHVGQAQPAIALSQGGLNIKTHAIITHLEGDAKLKYHKGAMCGYGICIWNTHRTLTELRPTHLEGEHAIL